MSGRGFRWGGRLSRLAIGLAGIAILAGLTGAPAGAQKGDAPGGGRDATQGAEPNQAGPPRLAAKAWILVDPRDGAILASHSPNKHLPIASATKLMTAYLALENLKPGQVVRAPSYQPSAAAEITLGLSRGERIRTRDLLYGLLVPSANDAAHALAYGVSGSVPAFVTEMNRAAQELGLADTSYANPIGLDDPSNYSSAQDLVTLAGVLLRDPLFARIVDSTSATVRSEDGTRQVTTRNSLLDRLPWVDGVKTGHTLGAGYVLVGSGTQNGTTLISAVLGTSSEAARDAATLELLSYGFSLYDPVQPVDRGEQLADSELDYRSENLPLVAERALRVDVREGQRVDTRVDAPEEVSGAVEEGQVLGKVTVTVDGERAAASPLVAAHSVEAATLFDKAESVVQNPFVLIALGAIVILVGTLLALRGRGGRNPETSSERAGRSQQQAPRQRTPEERRRMHEERMRRRRQRTEREGGTG
ncbi:MAG TPA: D-alanyl-D-alanine carboxypeptidase family protein [Solirubrobacterales bacterium]